MPSRRSKISLAAVVWEMASGESGEQRDRISGRTAKHYYAGKIGDIDGVFARRQHGAAGREFEWNGRSGDWRLRVGRSVARKHSQAAPVKRAVFRNRVFML